jgi:hypothetical protein
MGGVRLRQQHLFTLRIDQFGYNNLRYPRVPFLSTDESCELIEIPGSTLHRCRLIYSLSFVKLFGVSIAVRAQKGDGQPGDRPLQGRHDDQNTRADRRARPSGPLRPELHERGAKIVISRYPRRALPLRLDTELYKWRHLIENFFCKLKEFKRIAIRADKTDQSFAALIHVAAAVINSR